MMIVALDFHILAVIKIAVDTCAVILNGVLSMDHAKARILI